jgi:hypothetical protein
VAESPTAIDMNAAKVAAAARKMMGVAIPAQAVTRERSRVTSMGILGTISRRSSTRQDKTKVKCFKRGDFDCYQSGCHSKHRDEEVHLKHSHEEEPALSMAVAYEGKRNRAHAQRGIYEA